MFNKLVYRLVLIVSLFVVSASQQVFSAEEMSKPMEAAMETVDKININTATSEQLTAIKGLGMKKAQAVVDYRTEYGDFVNLEQLTNVKGIGEGTLKRIKPFLSI